MTDQPFDPVRVPAPWWVRLCMFGVPGRGAAMGFYWLFVFALIGTGIGAAGIVPDFSIERAAALVLTGYFTFASWSTSCTIQWLDKHGWASIR